MKLKNQLLRQLVFSLVNRQFYGQARKQRMGINNERPAREMFHATCAECGQDTEVPFRPSMDRPVYCRECFNARKG